MYSSKLANHLPKAHVIDIISTAVDIEMEFVINASLWNSLE
jgi:hypothetical protein